jgi:hypothetical protein
MMIAPYPPIDETPPRVFAPCVEHGCDWMVEWPASRCPEHGGSPTVQAYRTRGAGVELSTVWLSDPLEDAEP